MKNKKWNGITPQDSYEKGNFNFSPQTEKHMIDFSREYDLNGNQAITGSIDYYQRRCKELEAWGNQIKEQAEKEIKELKEMVKTMGEENIKLAEMLEKGEK